MVSSTKRVKQVVRSDSWISLVFIPEEYHMCKLVYVLCVCSGR